MFIQIIFKFKILDLITVFASKFVREWATGETFPLLLHTHMCMLNESEGGKERHRERVKYRK